MRTAELPDSAQSNGTLSDRRDSAQTVTEWPSSQPQLNILPLGILVFLAMLPVTMLVPVLRELVAVRFQTGPFATHSFMSVNMIGAVIAAPLAGMWSDRRKRRKPLLIGALVANSVLLLLMAIAPSFPLMLIIRLCEGAAHILVISALMALAADCAAPESRGRTMGLMGACLMMGTACGSPLGGLLGQWNPAWVLPMGSAISAMLAPLAAWLVHDTSIRRTNLRRIPMLVFLRAQRDLIVPFAYAFIDRFCVGIIVSSFVLYLGHHLEVSPAGRGGLLTLFMLPFALLCYPAGRLSDRFGRIAPLCLGSIGFGIVLALYGFVPLSWMWVLMVLSGIFSAAMFAPNLTLCADLSPRSLRGSAYAGFNAVGSFGFLCGPLIGGAVVSFVGQRFDAPTAYRAAFVVGGMSELLCALITLPWLLRLKRAHKTR